MSSKRIVNNLEDLIFNIKLAKPNFETDSIKPPTFQSQKEKICLIRIDNEDNISNERQKPKWKQLHTQLSESNNIKSQYDSVVNDNYDDFNTYSFYELKQTDTPNKQPRSEEFSFCQHFQSQTSLCGNDSHDDSLNRFSSIVDKLKTEGCQYNQKKFDQWKYFEGNSHEIIRSQREKFQYQPYFSQTEEIRESQRKRSQYFSGFLLKSAQKSYKNMTKKIVEPIINKNKPQPIYAKLTLNHDKQNNHQSSNICHKNSVFSSLTTKKSNYSSVMKKPFNPVAKNTSKSSLQNPITKVKVKELNEKIRKENQIVYQSELKERNPDVSPLQSFKKSTIQPHKFSSYKVKLFG